MDIPDVCMVVVYGTPTTMCHLYQVHIHVQVHTLSLARLGGIIFFAISSSLVVLGVMVQFLGVTCFTL